MILFIDTHTELITIALKTKDNLFIETKESEYSHSIYTMPMIEKLFELCDLYAKYSTKYDGKEQTGDEILYELYTAHKSDLENLDVNDLIKQFDDRIKLLKLAYENV